MVKYSVYIIFLAIISFSCKEPFNAEINEQQSSFLVVEGTIVNGNVPTTIHLSRSGRLYDSLQRIPETRATVVVESEDGLAYSLNEINSGVYSTPGLSLNPLKNYRLNIVSFSGKEYLSDFVPVKNTPAIDSVSWERKNGVLQLYANTHDPLDSTRYYHWDYEETWEIHSAFQTHYKYENGVVMDRDPAETPRLYFCWRFQPSTNIFLGSSANLESDIIFKAPLLEIPEGHEKVSVRYSILLGQYAITSKAYEFLRIMKKNTESTGSIFDPQPSDLSGNIRCVSDPQEKVIGFVMVSTREEKRIFISNDQLPGWNYSRFCETIFVTNHPDSLMKYFGTDDWSPYERIGFILGYKGSSVPCIDCTKRGSSDKPDFW